MQYLYALTWENDPYNVEKGVIVSKFNIYRRDRDSGQLWVKIDSVDASVLAYADKNVTAASYFEYYVTAVDNEGNESKIR